MNLILFRFIFLTLLLLAPLAWGQATAKVDSLVLGADNMTRDLKLQKIYLQGRVILVFQGQTVRADHAVIDTKNKTVLAEGSLSMVSAASRAVGTRAEFNYETNTGVLYEAMVEKDPQVQLKGKIIRQVATDEYEIESGEFTACTTCPPGWSFTGSHIRADVGRYAYISNTVLYFGAVPVFYLPYLVVPIATKRQTGLLFPSLGYGSSSKFVFSQPFFWAMSDSTDSTWTFENYQARGQKENLNFRYRLSQNSFGEFNTAYIQDGAVGQELRERGSTLSDTEKVQRSSLRYRHYYELPDGYIHRADINWVSDTLYPKDFPGDVKGHGDPALVSRMSLTKNSDTQHISAEVAHNRNMLATDPRGADDLSINRYPSVLHSLSPQRLTGSLLFEMDSHYTNFTRNTTAYDKLNSTGGVKDTPISIDPSPTSPGVYNSRTDLLRTGQRLELEPKISYPFNLGPYLDINPSLSFRETDYEFGVGEEPSAYRRFFRGTISARTQFGRVFGDANDPKADRYKHEIQPEIVYTNIPWIDYSNHAFFGANDPFYKREQAIGNADVPQFDDFDRLYDRHLTSFNLTNYLIGKTALTEGSNYSQILTFKLSQSYDNYEGDRAIRRGESREPWTPFAGTLDIRLPFLDSNTSARYYHYDKVTSISSRIRVTTLHKNYLQLSYSQDFQLKKSTSEDTSTGLVNTRSDINNYSQSMNIVSGYRAKYAGLAGFVTYNVLSQKWTEYGYVLDLLPPGDCWFLSFSETHPITESGGEAKFTFNVGINYGSGSQSMSSNALSQVK